MFNMFTKHLTACISGTSEILRVLYWNKRSCCTFHCLRLKKNFIFSHDQNNLLLFAFITVWDVFKITIFTILYIWLMDFVNIYCIVRREAFLVRIFSVSRLDCMSITGLFIPLYYKFHCSIKFKWFHTLINQPFVCFWVLLIDVALCFWPKSCVCGVTVQQIRDKCRLLILKPVCLIPFCSILFHFLEGCFFLSFIFTYICLHIWPNDLLMIISGNRVYFPLSNYQVTLKHYELPLWLNTTDVVVLIIN